jgi:hypothetical protein
MTKRVRDVPDTAPPLFSDMADQFELVKSMANGQREFLHGCDRVLPDAHLDTHDDRRGEGGLDQRVAKRRHAQDHRLGRAIVAVPTAVTGFFGQNVPYPGFGTKAGLVRLNDDHVGHGGDPVHNLQTQEMAVTGSVEKRPAQDVP